MRRSRLDLGPRARLFTLVFLSNWMWSGAVITPTRADSPDTDRAAAESSGKQRGPARATNEQFRASVPFQKTSDDTGEPSTGGPATQVQSHLEPNEAIVGIDSRLVADQYLRVIDSGTWAQLWRSHLGQAPTIGPSECPRVDFSRDMVVLLVEPRHTKSDKLAFESFSTTKDHAELLYRVPSSGKAEKRAGDQPKTKRKRGVRGNQYAFFVLPRTESPLILRKISDVNDDGVVVASFPRLDLTPHINTTMSQTPSRLNIGFAFDPGTGHYNGAVGSANEVWNFVDVGTTAIDHTRHADGSFSPVRIRVSPADGEWGIAGRKGIYHGYIYHNCRCVDLETRVLDLPEGRYRLFVFAHGDAPNQNARVEVRVDDESWGSRSTGNDDTWSYREMPYRDGVHYVQFEVFVKSGNELKIISHRDGSDYSMFNAIQIVPIES